MQSYNLCKKVGKIAGVYIEWPTFGTFSNMHGPKVPTVDPSLENSSQPKKFVIKSFFHLPHRNFMLQKYPIFRSNGGGERLIQFPFFLFL